MANRDDFGRDSAYDDDMRAVAGLDPAVTARLAAGLERMRSGLPYSTSFTGSASDATEGYMEPLGPEREADLDSLMALSQALVMAMTPVRPDRRFRDHLRNELLQMPLPPEAAPPAAPVTPAPPPVATAPTPPAISRRRPRRLWPFGRRKG